jgi:hypothetical protein
VQSITPFSLPDVRRTARLEEYAYPLEYYAAAPSRTTVEDGTHCCVQCGTESRDVEYTFCANCGSIGRPDHTKTERPERTPICTGCAVTERFALPTALFSRLAEPGSLVPLGRQKRTCIGPPCLRPETSGT